MDGSRQRIPAQAGSPWAPELAFLRRVLIVAAVVALLLLLWTVREALLLAFGGVVVAVLLLALATPLERRLGLSRGRALGLVCVVLLLALGLVAVLIGHQVEGQVAMLGERIPRAIAELERRFGLSLPAPEGGLDAAMLGTLASNAAGLGSMVVGALSALVVAVVGGVFLAADAEGYRGGLAKLLPKGQGGRAEEAMLAAGAALRLWLGAQLVSMAIVGTLAGLGCWALGLPSPLALGVFAGLANFIPLIGAVAGAVPPLLLALAEEGTTFLWTALLFLAIQQVESNMIMPLVERRMVSLPPALVLFAVVAVGLVFGLPGVILAAPITVVGYVLVKKLYVRETLGRATAVPGEGEAKAATGEAPGG